jgi:hypothetical protein
MSRQREQKLAAIYDAFDANNYKVSSRSALGTLPLFSVVLQCFPAHLQQRRLHLAPVLTLHSRCPCRE